MKKLSIKKPNIHIGSVLKSRRFRHGSMATIITALFIVAVVVINIIATLILERFPTNIDLTSNQIFQLTDESIDFAKSIDMDVNITVCKNETDLINNTYANQANSIIKSYAQYNSHVKVDYVDLLEEPTFASQYSDYGVTDYSVIVETEKRTKVLNMNDMFETSYDQTTYQQTTSSSAEQMMTSALMYVTDDKVSQVSILTGHSEVDVPGLTSMLEDNNYEATQQNIETEEINQDADIAVIYSPTTDYSAEELEKLDTFLDNNGQFGKTLIYVASIQQPEGGLPNLEAFLKEWGITVGQGVVAETDSTNIYGQSPYFFGANIVDDDENTYTKDLRDGDLPYLAYYTRPVTLEFEMANNRTAQLLLESPETSVLVPMDAESFDVDSAEQQSYGIAALGRRLRYADDGITEQYSNVLVFGGTGLFDESLISSSRYNNNEYAINVINKLTGKEDNLNIVSVSFDAEALNPTESVTNTISLVFTVLVPLGTLVIGVVIWLRRRHR